MAWIADELGCLAADLRYEHLPQETVDAVKLRLLDLLGASIAGYGLGTVDTLLPLVGEVGEATMWGTGRRMPLRDAVCLNSFMAHSSGLEDGSRFCGGHPSSAVIPAALTLAVERKLTGAALLAAITVGYEAFLRVGRAIYPAVVLRGFQSTAVLAGLSAAAACSSVLGLSRHASAHALAFGATFGIGFKDAFRSPTLGALPVARSVEGGVAAALMASLRLEGSLSVIERGLLRGFGDDADPQVVLEGLGSRFLASETYLKRHAGCRGTHAPVDLLMCMSESYGFTDQQIAAIEIGVDSVTFDADIDTPQNGAEAELSIRFAVAAWFLWPGTLLRNFTDDKAGDPQVTALMRRIRVGTVPELDRIYPEKRAAMATVRLRDGRSFEGRMDHARGEPENPMPTAEVKAKFRALAVPWLSTGKADALIEFVDNLENQADVGAISGLICTNDT